MTMITNYLSDEHMTSLLERVKKLRGNRPITSGHGYDYSVMVDNRHHRTKTIPHLRKFLEACTFPASYKVFVNAYGGVTIDLDT